MLCKATPELYFLHTYMNTAYFCTNCFLLSKSRKKQHYEKPFLDKIQIIKMKKDFT